VSASIACAVVTASSAAAKVSFFLEPVASSSLPSVDTVRCTVNSSATLSTELPRYGRSTALSIRAVALAAERPFIGSILTESTVNNGTFTSVAGAGLATKWALRKLDCVTRDGASFMSWSHPSIPDCPLAIEDIARIEREVASVGTASPSSLAVTVSSSIHMLLLGPRAGAPFPKSLAVTIGGVAATVNWVNGSFASITTPPFSKLCEALRAPSGATDCGTAQLVISSMSSWTSIVNAVEDAAKLVAIDDRLEAGNLSTVYVPAAFPPLQVGENGGAGMTATIDTAVASLVGPVTQGLSDSSALSSAAALSPEGIGIRVVQACTDPLYSPSYACAAASAVTYGTPPGLVCSWGGGDDCRPCPDGAACPGGRILRTSPGFWVPSSGASANQLTRCPDPAIERCPGWRNTSLATGCGPSFAGVACAACAKGFFSSGRGCSACPVVTTSTLVATVVPFLIFGGAIAALTVLLIAALHLQAGIPMPLAATHVAAFSLFLWNSAQSAAASFSLTQAFAPPTIAPLYSLLTSLQFAGVSLPAVCLDTPPYLSVFAFATTVVFCLVAGSAALVVLSFVSSSPRTKKNAETLLVVASSVFQIAFGATVSTLASVLPCTDGVGLSVRSYLALNNDGNLLAEALGKPESLVARVLSGRTASASDIARAAVDPPFASARGLSAVLDAGLNVRLVAGDRFSVCYEGAHRVAWQVAIGLSVALVVGVAALSFGAVVIARRARTWLSVVDDDGKKGVVNAHTMERREECPEMDEIATETVRNSGTCSSRLAYSIGVASTPLDLRPSAASFIPAQSALTAASSALTALAAAGSDNTRFIALLSSAIVLQGLFAVVTLRWAPFDKANAWKNSAVATLLALSMLSEAVSIYLDSSSRAGARPSAAAATAPVVVAFPIPLVVFVLWWRGATRRMEIKELVRDCGFSTTWERITDPDGDIYFYNPMTGESVWEPPEGHGVEESGGVGAVVEEEVAMAIPKDDANIWKRLVDDDGDVYFYNPGSGESSWELPNDAIVELIFSDEVVDNTGFVKTFDVGSWREKQATEGKGHATLIHANNEECGSG
jgi:hypothetical protein